MIQYSNLLTENARNFPDRFAVVSRYRKLTYTQLNTESNWVANALLRSGLKKSDRLALLAKNSVEWVVVWQACQKLGIVVVPLHTRLSSAEFVRILEKSECTALVYGESFASAVKEIREKNSDLKHVYCVKESQSCGEELWRGIFGELEDREANTALSSSDPALILFTSGTTSLSKGVTRTQEMLVLHGITLALKNDNTQKAVMLVTAPLYHSGGLLCMLKMSVVGGTLLLHDRFEPAEILDLIEQYRVTQIMMLPPITYERVYSCEKWRKMDLSMVREVCVSAGRCTCELAFRIFEMFPQCSLRPSWGSTETCSATGMLLSREELQSDPSLITCVGSANFMNEIRIVDSEGNDVAEGESGEALVRSPMVFSGYLGDTRAKEELFEDGEWFHTGDIMRMDPKTRYFYFLDRLKDMIKTGGENVYAPEVERIIQEHPSVMDCAIVGIPDERFGEGIAAAIVLREGCTLTAQELVEHCKKYLPSYKKPRYMAIVKSLPVNSVGKVQKTHIRENPEQFQAIY